MRPNRLSNKYLTIRQFPLDRKLLKVHPANCSANSPIFFNLQYFREIRRKNAIAAPIAFCNVASAAQLHHRLCSSSHSMALFAISATCLSSCACAI